MNILLIAQEPPLSDHQVVTGNAIRTQQLTLSLRRAGHEVTQVWRDPDLGEPERCFRGRDDLRGLLTRQQADIHLVSYWELLDLMPFESETPVILDFLAPRPIEQVFEDPAGLRRDLRRLQVDLSKVDLLLTGNERQKSMMLLPLLEAGLDLSSEVGVIVVPLSAERAGPPLSDPASEGWKLVSGGVNWPWRRAETYWRAIDEFLGAGDGPHELVLFGGSYPLGEDAPADAPHAIVMNPLMPYRKFSEWLLQHAHIGLELGEDNVERRLSQSFRSVEFLRHGLPLICNSWLPLAPAIERFDAGWLVDHPGQLSALLSRIFDDPDAWRRKSDNALRLVDEQLSADRCCAPLLAWLEAPRKAGRLAREAVTPPRLKVPQWKTRFLRMAHIGRRAWHPGPPKRARSRQNLGSRIARTLAPVAAVVRSPVFYLERLIFNRRGEGIVLITRGDLFPTDHGAAVKIVETARGLSRHGVPVALVTDQRRDWWLITDGEIEHRRVPWWIRMLAPPETASKALHYSKDIPGNNAFLYLPLSDNSFFWRTLYAGKQVGARVLQAEFPAYVKPGVTAAKTLDAHLVLVQHNVEYERIRSQVEELTDEQYRRYKAIEIDLSNQCDAVICVSDNDRQQLATDGVDLARLYTVPHGVDLRQFDLPPQMDVREKYEIPDDAPLLVYHGTFSYPPNLHAIGVFAGELLPRLDRLGLQCHVLAVGREPPPSSPHPRIHFTGSVDKVGPWIKAADLAVVPLLDGGGTRMKIIDCFAAGTPVISTAKGIEGIPVVHGQQALVIDDWDEMSAAIQRLLNDPKAAAEMTASAGAMAASMDWTSIAGRYLEIFDALGEKRSD